MRNIYLRGYNEGIGVQDIKQGIYDYFKDYSKIKNLLILPPDISRLYSYAGTIVNLLCDRFQNSDIDIMPAIGTHAPMSKSEIIKMYGSLDKANFIIHDWRNDTVNVGVVPADFVKEISEGCMNYAIEVEVNKRLIDKKYDLIISVGQVVPHEVAGFANYTKNILIGCGGRNIINQSHYLGALYGMERIMGRANTPTRNLYNYGFYQFLSHIPLVYILTVTTIEDAGLKLEAVSIGTGDELFYKIAKVSRDKNLNILDNSIKKAVVYLDPQEFKTTWTGNKSIYRTRMALADGGELLIIGPAIHGCGEDQEYDRLIKKYGYISRDEVLKAVDENEDLRNNLSVAAHLIHGSSEGRFRIIYSPGKMTEEEVLSIKYEYMPIKDAFEVYDINNLKDGLNIVNGEEIFYISNPALGLWSTRSRFDNDAFLS
jgi:nickel-dependent lactate racemase